MVRTCKKKNKKKTKTKTKKQTNKKTAFNSCYGSWLRGKVLFCVFCLPFIISF